MFEVRACYPIYLVDGTVPTSMPMMTGMRRRRVYSTISWKGTERGWEADTGAPTVLSQNMMVRGLSRVLRVTRLTDRYRSPFRIVEKYVAAELPYITQGI